MIILPIHAFILLILPTITNQQTVKSHIDWTICGTGARCFCLDGVPSNLPAKLTPKDVPEADPDKCNIGVQIKYYNTRGAFIQLQVIGHPDTAVKIDAKLEFIQTTFSDVPNKIFGCVLDKDKKINLEGDYINKFRIKLLEERSRFEPGNVVCAVQIEKADKFRRYVDDSNNDDFVNGWTAMTFSTSLSYEFPLNIKNSIVNNIKGIIDKTIAKCDPFSFKDLLTFDNYIVRPVINRDRDTLNCENYGDLFGMRYVNFVEPKEKNDHKVDELTCEQVSPGSFKYKIKGKDDSGNPTNDPVLESHHFFCAAKFDEICEHPFPECDSTTDPTCPIYKKGGQGVPAKLSCPGNKWLIENQYYNLDPVCKRDILYNENSAVFYANLPSGAPMRINEPRFKCFTEYDCYIKSKPVIVHCGDSNTDCVDVDHSNGILKCADDRQLNIYLYETSETIRATNYECDKGSGDWKNTTGGVLDLNSQLSCSGNDTIKEKIVVSDASLSDVAVWGIIGGIIVVTAIVVSICAILGRYYWRRRKLRLVKENKYWRKMKKPTRIENCKNLFSDVLHATPSSVLGITNGFNQIQLLLDEEIEEGECWEEAYPFFMRFQGAIRKKDFRIWHMLSRYMYLEAKKILDKYGWLTDKPIRKKKPHGLMRVAAIHMLSLAMYDSTNQDAELLIVSGFRKLGFKAVEQYPHCGVLWSVLMNAHATRKLIKKEKKNVFTYLKHDKFVERLRTVAFEGKMAIPAKDVIPVFGSVAEQAALALGSSPVHSFHMDNARDIMTTPPLQGDAGGGTVPLTYFKGICMAPTRNPVPLILCALRMWPNHQPQLLEKFYKIAPESSWNELIENTSHMLIYYGRPLDAKRLLDRFIPTRNFESVLGQINLAQHLFEDALDKNMEEVRRWFGTRTDIDKLKGKPNYTIDGDNHLDARIDADAAKAEAPTAETDAAAPTPESAAPAPNATAPTPNVAASSPNPADRTPNIAAPTPNAAAPAP